MSDTISLSETAQRCFEDRKKEIDLTAQIVPSMKVLNALLDMGVVQIHFVSHNLRQVLLCSAAGSFRITGMSPDSNVVQISIYRNKGQKYPGDHKWPKTPEDFDRILLTETAELIPRAQEKAFIQSL